MMNIILIFSILILSGCQTQAQQRYAEHGYPQSTFTSVKQLNLKELSDTIRTEHEDRINRLARLSQEFGIHSPTIQQNLQVDPNAINIVGVDSPIPVVRIRYEERVFFDFNQADIKPEAEKILDVIAEQMKHDLPDTSLVMLGHTDSRGTDEYNTYLSVQRAKVVMSELAKRGVNVEQMSTVGIGESQPIATNANEQGRALNRRVEFMLSRYAEANYVAIGQFPRNSQWRNNHSTEESNIVETIPKKLVVLKLKPKPSPDAPVVKVKPIPVIPIELVETDQTITLLPDDKVPYTINVDTGKEFHLLPPDQPKNTKK